MLVASTLPSGSYAVDPARLVPVAEPPRPRELGKDRGKIWIADDFDTLDPEILADFEGRD